MFRKTLHALLWIALAGALALVVLVKEFGMHVVLYGGGEKGVHFQFFKQEDRYSALEKHRAEQKSAPVPASAAAAAMPAPSGSAVVPEAAQPVSMDVDGIKPLAPASATPPYWTGFRGPHRDGIYDQTKILAPWPAGGLVRLWKQPVGGGYASFAVANGKAYTIEQRREKEVVSAYDVGTGRELWTQSWPGLFSEAMGGDGPRATPTWDNGRIYALGAIGHLVCLEADNGKVIWQREILEENHAPNLHWGISGSPLIVDGKVIVQPGGPDGKSVVAYDQLTGKPVWKALDDKQSYASPKLATILGVRQIVMVSALRVAGMKIEDGSLLWEFPWVTDNEINSAEPVFLDDRRFFISSGYNHGGALIEVSKSGDAFSAKQLWASKKLKTRFNAAVHYDGYLYGLDEGILACLDAATGELKWKGGRYGYGQVLLSAGKLIVLTEEGDLALLNATPAKLDEISRFAAIEGKTWNYPAIDGGVILVRNTTEMAAFKIL